MVKSNKTVLLDLDGVLNMYDSNYVADYIPPLREGAFSFVNNLSQKYNVKIFTSRSKKLVYDWLKEHNLNSVISGVTNVKEPAWLMVDDRCIKFTGQYDKLIEDIENFAVWYRE